MLVSHKNITYDYMHCHLRLSEGCPHVVYEYSQVLLTVRHDQEHAVEVLPNGNLMQPHNVPVLQLHQNTNLTHTAHREAWIGRSSQT